MAADWGTGGAARCEPTFAIHPAHEEEESSPEDERMSGDHVRKGPQGPERG